MPVPDRRWARFSDAGSRERWLGYEPKPAVYARVLLPLCLPSRSTLDAVGSFRDILHISTIDGELHLILTSHEMLTRFLVWWSLLRQQRQHQQAIPKQAILPNEHNLD